MTVFVIVIRDEESEGKKYYRSSSVEIEDASIIRCKNIFYSSLRLLFFFLNEESEGKNESHWLLR